MNYSADTNNMNNEPDWSHPFEVSSEFQTAPPRSGMTTDDRSGASPEPWPFAFGRGDVERQTAPEHKQADTPVENTPFVEPDEQPRPNVAKSTTDHGQGLFSGVLAHDWEDGYEEVPEPIVADEPTWPVAVEQEIVGSEPAEIVQEQTEMPAVKPPPESADLVTVEEAVEIFRQCGLPRHMRTIQKYCSRKTGRVLESYQVPTENGIRYMIERCSIDRFIGDAAMQAPTGKLENETIPPANGEHVWQEQANQEHKSAPVVDQFDIFDHPFVKRLEGQVERLESSNEELQANIQNVLEQANERLVELQKAAAVAQSESLGKFLLESERIRGKLEKTPPITVNRGAGEFPEFDV